MALFEVGLIVIYLTNFQHVQFISFYSDGIIFQLVIYRIIQNGRIAFQLVGKKCKKKKNSLGKDCSVRRVSAIILFALLYGL